MQDTTATIRVQSGKHVIGVVGPGKMVKVNEIIRKLDNGKYRLYSHSGKNLGTYDTRAGAEKRERQVQAFKHMEQDGVGHKTTLTNPQYTLVIDTPGELDWYKIGQHFPTLDQQPAGEFRQSETDMMVTLASEQELQRLKSTLSKLKIPFKDISGSQEHPEIHMENSVCECDIMSEEIANFDAQDPMASKVAVQGYGTMNLATLMKNVTSTIKQLGELRNDPASYRRLNYELYDSGVLQAKLSALITALDQLQEIKRKGGKRSVNIQREANQVRGSEPIPAKQKPSKGASSPHPYRGRLVGEAEQQELPVDLEKIRKAIQQLESRNYFTPEEADEMRRAVQAMATGRDTIYPKRLLQLLTMVA